MSLTLKRHRWPFLTSQSAHIDRHTVNVASHDFLNLLCFCSIQLVENIPDGFSFPADSGASVPLSAGLHALLDQAKHSVEVVSPVWDLQAEPNVGIQVKNKIMKLYFRPLRLVRGQAINFAFV